MYNIYIEEKRKRDIANKQKEEQKILKYRERFQSKNNEFIISII
jgi:hypothetical protein